jgi:hypothetical protein
VGAVEGMKLGRDGPDKGGHRLEGVAGVGGGGTGIGAPSCLTGSGYARSAKPAISIWQSPAVNKNLST